MKKLLAFLLSMSLILAFAGCSSPAPELPQQIATDPAPTVPDDPTEPPTEPLHPIEISLPMHAISLPTVTETVCNDEGVPLLSFSFQRAQIFLENEETAEKILGDLQTQIGPLVTAAEDLEALAREDQPLSEDWSPYFIGIAYTPTRLDQAVLSLFGNQSSYSGGPHPSVVTDSVTYDLQTGEVLYLDELLNDGCTAQQLCQKIIAALSAQAENLYYDYEEALVDRFTGDLHSIRDWYFSKNGLCFHFDPYDIAPYSSGTIVAELPYGELTDLLQEKYLPTEVPNATGSMYAESYLEDDTERFNTIAHVALQDEATDILLYSDAPVTDVRIESGFRYPDTQQYITDAVVFAADTVDIGDAIRLSADLSDPEQLYRLVYHSAQQEYSAFITYDDQGDSILLTNG